MDENLMFRVERDKHAASLVRGLQTLYVVDYAAYKAMLMEIKRGNIFSDMTDLLSGEIKRLKKNQIPFSLNEMFRKAHNAEVFERQRDNYRDLLRKEKEKRHCDATHD